MLFFFFFHLFFLRRYHQPVNYHLDSHRPAHCRGRHTTQTFTIDKKEKEGGGAMPKVFLLCV